jgi:periplasmic protein TonB
VIQSMAAKTVLASLVVHASVAVAIVSAPRNGTVAVHDGAIDVQQGEVDVSPESVPEEATPVLPEERAPQPDVVAHVAPNPIHARVETSRHTAEVLGVNREVRMEGDDTPDVVAAEPGARARFVMALGTGTNEAGRLAKSTGGWEDESETYTEAGVSSRARLLEGTPPEYPQAARAAAVEADLPLELVVDARGAVVDAQLLRHAGYGLDEAALRAVRAFRFIPAQRAGHGVSVRMRWVVNFRLD